MIAICAVCLRIQWLVSEEEQERRMRRLRQQVSDNNIYRWAGMLLSEAAKLLEARHTLAADKVHASSPSLVEVSS